MTIAARRRLVILASGNGSNAQAVIDACRGISEHGTLPADVVAVVSDRPQAHVLQRATTAGITAVALTPESGESRHDYDTRLLDTVAAHTPDVVVLAGWMRLLSLAFLAPVGVPVVNLHPALPGELPGTRAIDRAFAERAQGRRESGVMVHLVPDEGVDDGPVLATARVSLCSDDTLESFAERMHRAEHALLVHALGEMMRERIAT
jgi:phosphoribosylglycinamide formyltransferase 1